MPSPDAPTPSPLSPSSSLFANLRAELVRALPFSRMLAAHVDELLAQARQAYFAPDEVVLEAAMGPVHDLHYIRQGSVTGRQGLADTAGPLEYVSGELFPVGAVLGQRAVSARYVANADTFCLLFPAATVQAVAERSAPFADFLNHRVQQFLELSRRAAQAALASQTLAEQAFETALGTLARKTPLVHDAGTPLSQALADMHQRRVGSVVVTDAAGAPCGILTRHDILGRVTLPQRPLGTALGEVMSTPVHSLTTEHSLLDAALLMSRHGVRHVPVTERGRLVNIVSERDLFALQRLSIKQLSTQLRAAPDLATLRGLAVQMRHFARNLLGQGVRARQITELVSHLNDVLTERLVRLIAQRRGLDLARACWLAFGSEGRSEQTISTDQDNGLVFVGDTPELDREREREREAWLALGLEVNQALDACGYPLCKGQVMASNPACCLTATEWASQFTNWMDRGTPSDLLKASIYFDLRGLCGNTALVQPLRDMITHEAATLPRFLRQMAGNALQRRSPLNWRGAIDTRAVEGRPMFDLKLQGSALFVEAARLYALAQGVPDLGTRARLTAVAPLLGVAAQEGEAWVSAFEFLQLLRLQLQIGDGTAASAEAPQGNPNLIDVSTLNDIDQRMLKETCKVARRLQQRLELDYLR